MVYLVQEVCRDLQAHLGVQKVNLVHLVHLDLWDYQDPLDIQVLMDFQVL